MSSESFAAPTLEELAPLFPNYSIDACIVIGEWRSEYAKKPGHYFIFQADNRAKHTRWKEVGTWKKTETGHRVLWNSGKWIDLSFDGRDTLNPINSDGRKKQLLRK